MDTIERILGTYPRVVLGHWPTPLEPLDRLRAVIGGPRIWCKRDDCSGLAFGGNKTRKLEFLLGRALADGADTVITFGALQSNHARQTAAACARLGLACHLILTEAVDRTDAAYLGSGNLLLDRLFGAQFHVVADPDAAFHHFAALDEELVAGRAVVATIGPGGSDPIGTLGYVAGAAELGGQCRAAGIEPVAVFVAASTAGTAAGLSVGRALGAFRAPVHAACVYTSAAETASALGSLTEATAEELERHGATGVDRAAAAAVVTDTTLGEGYGIPSAAGEHAIDLLARREGLLLDPVYTAKAFATLLRAVHAGEFPDDADVVFVHTGGAPGLFAYAAGAPS